MTDDADVYILLLYHYQSESVTVLMKLQSTQSGSYVINIAATVQSLYNIIPELLPAHALSGCDTVAMFHGFGKAKMLKSVAIGKEV